MTSEDRTRRNGELVNATALARHLCFERAYLDKLINMGVVLRRDDGKFDLDENRRRYILHLREERKRSPKSEADTEFQRAKSELIRLRVAEKTRKLILADEAYTMIEEMVGMFLSALSGFQRGAAVAIWLRAASSNGRCTICVLSYPKPRPSWRISAASLH